VTIVGSRRSTAYGRRSAEALAAQMALRGITFVSGLALGIDGASHRGVVEAGGDTIAVLDSGVDLIQPASHRRLGERVAREGLILSEFLPGEPVRAHHFPRRNRILAALGGAVVVVEATEKSGALITVEHALDLGRDVREDSWDSGVLRRARREPRKTSRSAPATQNEVPSGLDDEARRVWLALGERSLGINDVASSADLQSAPVLAALTILQVAGLVVQEPGMRFRRAS
jgi:predicted Rossmann fold nucleotide-binding protein DprA/Smf involved in DNA uptake